MVGRQEVWRSIVCGVVDHGARTSSKSSIHDQSHRFAFDLPITAFGTIDVDVACTAVSKRSIDRLLCLQLKLPKQQRAVALDHLSYGNLSYMGFVGSKQAQRLTVFQHHLFAFKNTEGQSTPRLVVLVGVRPLVFRSVAVVNVQFTAFGQIVGAEVEAPSGGPFGLNTQPPNTHAVFLCPGAVALHGPSHFVFDAKPPWGILHGSSHCIFSSNCCHVQGSKSLAGNIRGGFTPMKWLSSMLDLGKDAQRPSKCQNEGEQTLIHDNGYFPISEENTKLNRRILGFVEETCHFVENRSLPMCNSMSKLAHEA